MLIVIVATGIAHALDPPSNVETTDPVMLHLQGEFAESNLGTALGAWQMLMRSPLPALQLQRTPYIERQLGAFGEGMRQNDISEQMRTVAVFYGAQGSEQTGAERQPPPDITTVIDFRALR